MTELKNSRFEREVQGGSVQPADRAHLTRVTRLAAILLVVEACLVAFARSQPSMTGLFRPVYWAVAIVFAVAIGRALRRRGHGDRRQGDRRHSMPGEP
jgi:hypothetical protein